MLAKIRIIITERRVLESLAPVFSDSCRVPCLFLITSDILSDMISAAGLVTVVLNFTKSSCDSPFLHRAMISSTDGLKVFS